MTTISQNIEKLALKISDLNDQKASLEEELKTNGEQIQSHQQELADLLASEGFSIGSKIKLNNGRTLEIKDFFSASIPSQTSISSAKDPEKQQEMIDKKEQCLGWLDDNNLSDVIKNNIVVTLDRGENEKAKEILLSLQEQGVQAIKEESVHPMTLKATLKEALKQGKNVPFDIFSVQTGTTISIK